MWKIARFSHEISNKNRKQDIERKKTSIEKPSNHKSLILYNILNHLILNHLINYPPINKMHSLIKELITHLIEVLTYLMKIYLLEQI